MLQDHFRCKQVHRDTRGVSVRYIIRCSTVPRALPESKDSFISSIICFLEIDKEPPLGPSLNSMKGNLEICVTGARESVLFDIVLIWKPFASRSSQRFVIRASRKPAGWWFESPPGEQPGPPE